MMTNEKHLTDLDLILADMEEHGVLDQWLEELAEESYMQSMMERGICPF